MVTSESLRLPVQKARGAIRYNSSKARAGTKSLDRARQYSLKRRDLDRGSEAGKRRRPSFLDFIANLVKQLMLALAGAFRLFYLASGQASHHQHARSSAPRPANPRPSSALSKRGGGNLPDGGNFIAFGGDGAERKRSSGLSQKMNELKPNLGVPAVIVTGATEGIGRALAEEFARSGHTLVLVARDEADLARAAAELSRKYSVAVRVTAQDLSTVEGCAGVEQALRRFGSMPTSSSTMRGSCRRVSSRMKIRPPSGAWSTSTCGR